MHLHEIIFDCKFAVELLDVYVDAANIVREMIQVTRVFPI